MRKSYFPWIWSLALFAVGCAVATVAASRLAAAHRQLRDARFVAVTDEAIQNVVERIHVYEYGLRGARGAVIAVGTEQVTRGRFHSYAASRVLDKEFPGARGFGFIRRVPASDIGPFTERVRRDGKPAFAVRQLAAHSGDLLVIEYIEPEAANLEAIGLDIASEARRRDAAYEALRSGNPTLSRPITLVQASGRPEQGFVFLIPLYRPGAPVATPQERWQAGVGLAYAPLVVDEMLASLDLRHSELTFALLDADTPQAPQRFYASSGWDEPAAEGLQRRAQIAFYGRQWFLEFKATPRFVADLRLVDPSTALRSGVAISCVLSVLLFVGLLSIQQRRQAALDDARMAAIAESVSDGLIGLDAQQRVMSWNRAAEQIFGRAAADAIGRPFREVLPEGTDADATTRLKIVRPQDGAELDLDLMRAPVRAHGGVVGTAVTVRDVTVQQSADERFRLAVDAAPTAMLMVDGDQRVVLANRKAEDLFGYREAQLLGMPIDTLVPWRYRARHAHDFDQYMQRPRARPMGQGRPLFALHKDGREIPVEIGLSPVRTRHGMTALATVTDVSQRWALEVQLHATLQRLQMAVGVAGLGVWVRRLADGQLIWDERMFVIYGVPPEQREQARCLEIWRTRVHPEDRASVEDCLQRHLRGDAHFDPVFRIQLESGELRYIQAAAIVERTVDGEPVQIVGINRDITEQKSAETRILELNSSLEGQVERRTQQLHEALLAAETATRAKSEFLANMSHEIRSPMNAILGLCYLLEREPLPATSRDMVLRIQGAGRALLGIINDILDLSKIEAHRLDLEHAPFCLSEVLDNLASIMASSLGDKPVELLVGPAPAGAEHLVGDSLRLSQVLVNLASNAIKFTAQGEVAVRVDRVDGVATEERVMLRFTVRDTGVGIAQDKQALIFEAFSQADSSTTRRYGGTGLGLTISSHLVALMGGQLTVESAFGRGSSFSFTLQFPTVNAATGAPSMQGSLRVLIVHDNAAARGMLADMVFSLGWHADVAASGEDAIAQVGARQTSPYDVVLLDLHMPGTDGLQAACRMRAPGGTGPSILVMATARDRDRLQAADAQGVVDGVVQKPVTGSGFYNAVVEAMRKRDGLRFAVPARHAEQRLRGLRLLVVDDSEINRDVAARILGSEGASTWQAENGAAALTLLQDNANVVDGVLMDIQMPGMDGYEATRRIRGTPALRGLPVVALSAGAFTSQRAQALAAGVDAFVAKPFDVDVLVDTLRRLCRPGEPAREAAPLAPAKAVSARIDYARGQRLWGDAHAFAGALAKFVDRYGDAGKRLETLSQTDAAALLHKLKGTAAQLGITPVVLEAEALEHALQNRAGETGALHRLQDALDGTRALVHGQVPVAAAMPAAPPPDSCTPTRPAPEIWAGLLDALASDDAQRIESAIAAAAERLPAEVLEALRTAVAYYEFRAAEDLIRSAAAAPLHTEES